MSARRGPPWSDEENRLVVADYLSMLVKEISGESYSKAGHLQNLLPLLNGRSRGAIEFKRQNISAVLMGLGEAWIDGYKPAANFQDSLVRAVCEQLPGQLANLDALAARRPKIDFPISVEPAPTMRNLPPPDELGRLGQLADEHEVALRDARNRELGKAGEEMVLEHERSVLEQAGRPDLASEIRWVARDDGDGAGYDIRSFDAKGRDRFIEVKTTNGSWNWTPFYITRNEKRVSDELAGEWCLFRLWNFRRVPKAFELRPPLERHVELVPTVFRAQFGVSPGEGVSSVRLGRAT